MPFTLLDYETAVLREIRLQSRAAIYAWQSILSANTNRDDPEWQDKIWFSIHNFATACANVSKLLNTNRSCPGIASRFCNINLSALIDREWRNSLEHFDERLKSWFKVSGPASDGFQDRAIGSSIGMNPPPVQFRRFDPIDKILFVLKQDGSGPKKFHLEPIYQSVAKIFNELGTI